MLTDTFLWLLLGIIAVLVLFERIATITQRSTLKKVAVLTISAGLIGWLDIFSLFLLTLYATLIIFAIKHFPKFIQNTLVFVVSNIVILIFIKDYYLLIDIDRIYVPLGVSYYFFRLISFVIEHNKKPDTYKKIPYLDYYLYVYFFPLFLAGPIQRFNDFYFLNEPLKGIIRLKTYHYLAFVVLVKLFFVDVIMYYIAYQQLLPIIKSELLHHMLSHHLFLFGFTAFLHAYLDLMIYTEISKTIASLLGFSKQENFNKPLLATNISRFWQSWHMSLSNWTRDYIFFPTLIKTKKVWFSTYASMMVIGIWHSISFNWIFWAFMHGSALNLYLWMRNTRPFKILSANPISNLILKVSGNVLTISFVSLVFIIVATNDNHVIVQLGFTLLSAFKGLL